MCAIFWAGQKRAITELKPLLGRSNFDRSETNHDRAKTCMTGQHDRPLSKTYSKPHPLSSTHSKGDYQSYCWPYSTWLCVIGTPMGQTFLIHVLRPGGRGTLGISGWGCVAGTLEPLTYTRASSAEFCYPILE